MIEECKARACSDTCVRCHQPIGETAHALVGDDTFHYKPVCMAGLENGPHEHHHDDGHVSLVGFESPRVARNEDGQRVDADGNVIDDEQLTIPGSESPGPETSQR